MSEVGALNESGAVDCVTPLVPSRFSIKRPASEPLVSQSKCQLMDSSIQPDTTTPVKQPTASLFSDGQLQTTGVQYIIFLVDWSSFIPFFPLFVRCWCCYCLPIDTRQTTKWFLIYWYCNLSFVNFAIILQLHSDLLILLAIYALQRKAPHRQVLCPSVLMNISFYNLLLP